MADPKSEVEQLMNDAVGVAFADSMLRQHGEFFPYGVAMKPDGEIVSVAIDTDTDQPASEEVIDVLEKSMKESAELGEYKAAGIFYDVRVTLPSTGEPSDAIAASLFHAEGYSVTVFFPYRIESEGVEYGELFAQAADNVVFAK